MFFDVKSFLLSENIPKQYRNYLSGSVDPDFQQLVVNRTSRSSDLKVLNNTYHGSGIRGIDIYNPTLSTEDIFWRIKIDQSVPVLPGKLFLDIAGSPDLPQTQYPAFGITLGSNTCGPTHPLYPRFKEKWEAIKDYYLNRDGGKAKLVLFRAKEGGRGNTNCGNTFK